VARAPLRRRRGPFFLPSLFVWWLLPHLVGDLVWPNDLPGKQAVMGESLLYSLFQPTEPGLVTPLVLAVLFGVLAEREERVAVRAVRARCSGGGGAGKAKSEPAQAG
jgi:hypothetical protein